MVLSFRNDWGFPRSMHSLMHARNYALSTPVAKAAVIITVNDRLEKSGLCWGKQELVWAHQLSLNSIHYNCRCVIHPKLVHDVFSVGGHRVG